MFHNKNMKGQIFLLAAFLFAAMFAVGFSSVSVPDQSPDYSAQNIAENIASEAPSAFNFGLKEGLGAERLADFTMLMGNITAGNSMAFSGLWLAAVPDSGTLDIYVGNYLGEAKNFTLSVDSEEKSILLGGDSYGMAKIAAGNQYVISLSYPDYSRSFNWSIYKANMYMEFSVEYQGNTVKRSVVS